MPLPPPPEGLRPVDATTFTAAPAAWSRWRVALLAGLAVLLGGAALRRWGGAMPGVIGALLAFAAWLAAAVAQWLCLRRDVPALLEVAAAECEETERGAVTVWHFGPPVPPGLRRIELTAEWTREVSAGDLVPVRCQETGYGTFHLVFGVPAVDGWRLPAPRPVWPPAAQAYAVAAFVGLALAAAFAFAPSRPLVGTIRDARQDPWVTGLGQEPWQLAVLVSEPGADHVVEFTLPHEDFLRLLPNDGRRALAAPGLLSGDERERLWSRYLPVGARVALRRTTLGPWRHVFYVGPAP